MSLGGFMSGPNGEIDWFVVNPVVLGSGKPLFREIRERPGLKLLKARTLSCGDLILYYRSGAEG